MRDAVTTMLETYDMNSSAGSDTTGKSSSTLDIGTTSANGKQFRLLRSAEDPENEDATAAFASVIVVSNLEFVQRPQLIGVYRLWQYHDRN